jgi:phosphoglycolate phosphatase
MSLPDRESRISWPEAIVWDLDGTLIDSAHDLATALNTVLQEQGQHSLAIPLVRTLIGGGVGKLIERAFRSSSSELDAAAVESLVPRFMEIYRRCATERTRLSPGVREVLERFYHAGVRMGICTNKPEAVTRQILGALDIHRYFDSVVGGDSTAYKKPHPLPLQSCMGQLDVTPERCIMVGDSAADVGAARAAGLAVILVPDGYTGAPTENLGADFVLDNISDLPVRIAQFRPVQKSA